MDYATLLPSFKDALDKNQAIIMFLRCSIHYSGRAESYLPEGDRIVIIKQDRTLLIHQPEGSAPVNYMKAGTSLHLCLENKKLELQCKNLAAKEYLDISISQVHSFICQNMEDNESLQIVGSERDMSDMLYDSPEMIEPGFKPLSREEHTKYGFIDLFGHDKDNILVVIECKRYAGDLHAVTQLRRYVEKISSLKGLKKVRGILACPKISSNAKKMLEDFGFEYRQVRPPKYLLKFDQKQKKLGEY